MSPIEIWSKCEITTKILQNPNNPKTIITTTTFANNTQNNTSSLHTPTHSQRLLETETAMSHDRNQSRRIRRDRATITEIGWMSLPTDGGGIGWTSLSTPEDASEWMNREGKTVHWAGKSARRRSTRKRRRSPHHRSRDTGDTPYFLKQ